MRRFAECLLGLATKGFTGQNLVPEHRRLEPAAKVESEFDKDSSSALLPSLRREYNEAGGVVVVDLTLPRSFEELSEREVDALNAKQYGHGHITLCQKDKNRMTLVPEFVDGKYKDKLLATPLHDLRSIVAQNFLHRKLHACTCFCCIFISNMLCLHSAAACEHFDADGGSFLYSRSGHPVARQAPHTDHAHDEGGYLVVIPKVDGAVFEYFRGPGRTNPTRITLKKVGFVHCLFLYFTYLLAADRGRLFYSAPTSNTTGRRIRHATPARISFLCGTIFICS